jgi:hypothetical protein
VQKITLSCAIVLAGLMMVLYSCGKQEDTDSTISPKISNPQNQLIQSVQEFYQSSVHAPLNVQWDKPYISLDKKRISFPLIWRATFETNESAYRRLIFTKDDNGRMTGKVIEVVPTVSYFNTHKQGIDVKNFEGTFGLFNLEMKFQYGEYYEKGIRRHRSDIKRFASKSAYTLSPKPEDCYSAQTSYFENGTLVVVAHYWCTNAGGFGNENEGSPDPNGSPIKGNEDHPDPEWSGGGGVNNANLPPTITDIKKDKVKDPCLSSTIDLALSKGLKNEITNSFNELFSGVDGITITFLDGPLPKPTEGVTEDVGRYDIEITLDNTTLPKSAQEEIVATILHEAIHAMYDAKGLESGANKFSFSEYIQHNLMADRYVSKIAAALKEMFPNLGFFVAKALAWGGLQNTASWKALKPTDANNFLLAAEQYNDKHKKGTHCK